MKKKGSALAVILCPLLWCTTTAALAEGNANIYLGVRSLDEGTWSPVDDHVMGGVGVDFAGKGWPLHMAAGIYRSNDEEKEFLPTGFCPPIFCIPPEKVKAKASVSELALGVVKIWKPGESVRLSLGGGGSLVTAEIKFPESGASADDRSPGMYATAGIFWASDLGDLPVVFNFGFEAKYLVGTDIELFGVEADADYKQLSVQLGLGW